MMAAVWRERERLDEEIITNIAILTSTASLGFSTVLTTGPNSKKF